MTFRTGKTGAARNSFPEDWEGASLCFGCTETACYPLIHIAGGGIPSVYTV
nr:hypothetical protein [Bacteroides intestinalis]